jgi:hypothetical protein
MADLTFSQSSLQDYTDCPRRFELRYLLHARWPGYVESDTEEIRKSLEMGSRFHLLCQQLFSDVPQDVIRRSIHDDLLLDWWDNFTVWKQTSLSGGRLYPEITLHAHIGGRQVLAKYDLVQVHEGEFRIYDWKTTPTRHPRRWLEKRIQTALYPLVMTLAGQDLGGERQAPLPENVSLTYWFVSHPYEPEYLPYSRTQYESDLLRIESLIEQITATPRGGFALTPDVKKCRFCVYRTYCNRPVMEGLAGEEQDASFETAMDDLAAAFERRLDQGDL